MNDCCIRIKKMSLVQTQNDNHAWLLHNMGKDAGTVMVYGDVRINFTYARLHCSSPIKIDCIRDFDGWSPFGVVLKPSSMLFSVNYCHSCSLHGRQCILG